MWAYSSLQIPIMLVFSSWICSNLQRAEVTFVSLLPPEAERMTAAYSLHKLLGENYKLHGILLPVLWKYS